MTKLSPERALIPATRNDPLVSADWLAAHANDAALRIVDASYRMPAMRPPSARAEYDAWHIPGAVFFDIDAIADSASTLPHMLPSPHDFARHMESIGIGDDDLVVIYDSGSFMGAPRAFWMLRTFGHAHVKVLDGGLKAWIANGGAVDGQSVMTATASYTPHFHQNAVRDLSQIVANTSSVAEQIVDARARERFEGAAAEPWPGRRNGHIPGSRNVPFTELIDASTGTMKAPDALRAVFSDAGVKLDQPIVASCGSGVTAGVITLALARLGVDDSAVYDGSWAEYGLPDGPPVATGPADA